MSNSLLTDDEWRILEPLLPGAPLEAVFENAGNDFPQRVIYRRDGDTRLLARIDQLATLMQRLQDENRSLRQQHEQMANERAQLLAMGYRLASGLQCTFLRQRSQR